MKRQRKRRGIAKLIFIIGLVLICYPHIARKLDNKNSTKLADEYSNAVDQLSDEEIEEIVEELKAYGGGAGSYEDLGELAVEGDVFATVSVPKLQLNLPIYLGPTQENLEKGIAHVEGTSLPMGGNSTHCVLAGHAGCVEEYFTNIGKLEEGDLFYIKNIETTLTYKVIRKKIIEPYDASDLQIVENKDLATLLTCMNPGTPNNKRLIITGERVLD